MSRKNLKLNYCYNVAYQVLTILTPFITAPHISRAFGPEGVGTYSYAESIVSYFALFAALGIPAYAQREISYTQNDIKKRSEVFWNAKALSGITVSVALLLYLVFCAFQNSGNTIRLVLAYNLLNILLDVSVLYIGMEEFGIITLRNVVIKLINVIFILVFIDSREDLVLYALGNAVIGVASCLSLWPGVNKYIEKPNVKEVHPFRYLRPTIALFIPTIAIQVYTVLDKTMIGMITKDASENGYYEQAIKLAKIVVVLVTSIDTVMLPRMGYFFRDGDKKRVDELTQNALRFTLFLGVPICLGLMSVASHFVPWFYGTDFLKVADLLQILSFLVIAIGINSVTGGAYLIATQQEKRYTKSVIIGALINFALNSVLITRYQSVGASIASVIAESSIAVVQLIMIRKDVNWPSAFLNSWKYYAAGICMVLFLGFEKMYLLPSVSSLICLVASGTAFYFFLLFILKDSFFLKNVRNILSKIRR